MSTTCILFLWLYLGMGHYKWNVFVVGAVALIPIFLWLSYSFSKASNKSSELKIKEFKNLSGLPKWIYLLYTSMLMIVAPVGLILALILQASDII